MPDCSLLHAIIHPSSSLWAFFFIAAANAAARIGTKLALWPPPLLSVCWRVCLFSMSPPQSLFPFQSFTKNFFSSFYNFFSPHICTSITRPGNGRPGESCDLRSCCCLGEEKGSVCQKPFSWASWEVRGQLDSQLKPQKSQPTFTQSFPSVCCLLHCLYFGLRFSFQMSHVKAWGWLTFRNLPMRLASLNIRISSTSPQQGSELDIDWGAVLMHLCEHVKESRMVMWWKRRALKAFLFPSHEGFF